jgi:hypothetical protein
MDEEEARAYRLWSDQLDRFIAAGRVISFWSDPEEIKISHEIEDLKKMSRSYQQMYGTLHVP